MKVTERPATNNQLSAFDSATDTQYLGETGRGTTVYTGSVNSDWCIGSVPHGGYVLALAFDAVLKYTSQWFQKDPVALNAFYLRKSELGPCIVEIEPIKTSKKGYVVLRFGLKQNRGKEKVALKSIEEYDPAVFEEKIHCIVTMGNMDNEKGVTHMHKELLPPDRSVMEPFKHIYMGDYVEGLLDKSTLPSDYKTGKGKPEFNQFIGFSDGRPTDYKSISYWCDMFVTPPVLLGWNTLGGPVWAPTMQLEVQFKRRPAGKRVLTSIIARHIVNGRFDCEGGVWDEQGNLLAITRHQCLIVPWSRNSKMGGTPPKARF